MQQTMPGQMDSTYDVLPGRNQGFSNQMAPSPNDPNWNQPMMNPHEQIISPHEHMMNQQMMNSQLGSQMGSQMGINVQDPRFNGQMGGYHHEGSIVGSQMGGSQIGGSQMGGSQMFQDEFGNPVYLDEYGNPTNQQVIPNPIASIPPQGYY